MSDSDTRSLPVMSIDATFGRSSTITMSLTLPSPVDSASTLTSEKYPIS